MNARFLKIDRKGTYCVNFQYILALGQAVNFVYMNFQCVGHDLSLRCAAYCLILHELLFI